MSASTKRNEPLIDLETQALAAEKAIARYVRRYAQTLAQAVWSNDAIWLEVKRLLEAVRDEVLTGRKARPHALPNRHITLTRRLDRRGH